MATPKTRKAPTNGPAFEAQERRELGIRVPERKEARKFVQTIQSLMVAIQRPVADSGEYMDDVLSEWIERLTDHTAEEIEEFTVYEMRRYGSALFNLSTELAEQPTKKRS